MPTSTLLPFKASITDAPCRVVQQTTASTLLVSNLQDLKAAHSSRALDSWAGLLFQLPPRTYLRGVASTCVSCALALGASAWNLLTRPGSTQSMRWWPPSSKSAMEDAFSAQGFHSTTSAARSLVLAPAVSVAIFVTRMFPKGELTTTESGSGFAPEDTYTRSVNSVKTATLRSSSLTFSGSSLVLSRYCIPSRPATVVLLMSPMLRYVCSRSMNSNGASPSLNTLRVQVSVSAPRLTAYSRR